jgi:hypothetical protein
MNMDNKSIDDKLKKQAIMQRGLSENLSKAIAHVLNEYDIKGDYVFNVYRDEERGMEPVTKIKNVKLKIPIWSISACYSNTGTAH